MCIASVEDGGSIWWLGLEWKVSLWLGLLYLHARSQRACGDDGFLIIF